MKIAIIGAGYTGMSIAKGLASNENEIIIFEKNMEPSGMVSTFDIYGTRLEKYYRHIFKSDVEAINLINELGLKNELIWPGTKMGYLINNKILEFGTPISLLRFKELNFIEKLHFGFNIVHIKLINSHKNLEKYTAEEWLTKRIGKEIYSKIWEPLLISKFGDKKAEISMAWLWGKIKLRSTSSSKDGEELGYINGSYQKLTDKFYEYLISKNIKFEFNTNITKIEKTNDKYTIFSQESSYSNFDTVISTLDYKQCLKVFKGYYTKEEEDKMKKVEYTAARTMVIVSKKEFSKYYWINVGDNNIPFGGIIEHTNFINKENYNNKHIIYISNYMSKENKLYRCSKDELLKEYLKHLKNINNDFTESDIEEYYLFDEECAQPIITCNYSKKILDYKLSNEEIYICTMPQIYPEDRGMNYAIKSGIKVANLIKQNKEQI